MVGFPFAVYVLLYYNCPLRRVQLTILHGNSILSYHAGVVELADSTDLGSVTFMVCGFDSRRPHQKGRPKKMLGVKPQCFQGFRGP